MLIALDYDRTYTADPALWDAFIDSAKQRGNEVHIVTMRHESEPLQHVPRVNQVHYTDRQAKRDFMQSRGLTVQIWIDDMPDFVLFGAAPRGL